MDIYSYRILYNENLHKKNITSHSYRNVYDKTPYTKKLIVIRIQLSMTQTHKNMYSHSYRIALTKRIWIVIRTEMCMTKTHTQRNG